MKKGKKLTDNDLEKYVSGGSILKVTNNIGKTMYRVVDENGEYVGEFYDDLGAAQEFARSKNLSTRIISHGDLWKMQVHLVKIFPNWVKR